VVDLGDDAEVADVLHGAAKLTQIPAILAGRTGWRNGYPSMRKPLKNNILWPPKPLLMPAFFRV
jgi:hypothetical protein